MRVVFLQTVPGTADVGEVKNVADGYARNFLLPRQLAAPATANYLKQAQSKAQAEARQQAKLDAAAMGSVKALEGKPITIAVRVGEQGRLYGSVTSQDIAEEATKLAGQEIDHRQIQLPDPIREVGEYNVELRLTRNVGITLPVAVVPIEQEQASES